MWSLSSVFKVHRFVAGGFGVLLLVDPNLMNSSFGSTNQLAL